MWQIKFCDFGKKLLITVILTLYIFKLLTVNAAIIPPPWTDPEKNPCAAMPGGWQLVYWPPLQKCFQIFKMGYPCPETMELAPIMSKHAYSVANVECRCPPGTALNTETNKCYKFYERGPCAIKQYFSPTKEILIGTKHNRKGICKKSGFCGNDKIFWPADEKCYTKFTKGPCVKGKLLMANTDGFGQCQCESTGEMKQYFSYLDESCYEFFTKGPCSTPGHLFLPKGFCGCHENISNYYQEYDMCFELDTPGPCPKGHIFKTPDDNLYKLSVFKNRTIYAKCECKEGYILWQDGQCYRLYTQGPCSSNQFLINATTCINNFCGKRRLYFPDQKSCYRIGFQGPCPINEVVVFDLTTRTSIDGISYNGKCG